MEGRLENVIVLGASDNPDRYAYKAVQLLKEHGHYVIPVGPKAGKVASVPGVASLADITPRIAASHPTLTMYVGESISSKLNSDILRITPRRVIFNPGAENPALAEELVKHGIEVINACTLVMLRTGQF